MIGTHSLYEDYSCRRGRELKNREGILKKTQHNDAQQLRM
jgi:hypothetical protein